MIVAYRESDLTIRTVMKAEDPDEILDIFEALAYSMFKQFDHQKVFESIERAAKRSAANG